MKQIAWIGLSLFVFLDIAQAASNGLSPVSPEKSNKDSTLLTRQETNSALIGSWKWGEDRIEFGSDRQGIYYKNNTICFKFSYGLSTANFNGRLVNLIGGVVEKQKDCDLQTINAVTGGSFGVFSYEYSIVNNILSMKSHQYSLTNNILAIKSTGIESNWEKIPNVVRTSSPLCSKQEFVIFSCSIANTKTLSICSAPGSTSEFAPSMEYRFGTNGKTPELIYPKHPKRIEDAFTFSSYKNSTGFPLEIISFSIGTINYDVISPDKASYVRWAPFSGVEVTLPYKPPQLLECDDNVVVDFQPIKNFLHISEDAEFSDALPKVKVENSAFAITHNVTTDKEGAETTISYPTINQSNVDSEISKFIGNCDWEDYSHTKGSKCSNTVSASIIKDEYLVIHFVGYMYAAGTPHGYSNQHTKIYRKIDQIWQPIKGSDFFVSSNYCHEKINSIIYRQLKPSKLSSLETNQDSDQAPIDLIKEADIYPTAQGIEFAYQQYQLGSYAQTPWPVLIPWKNLSKCLRSQ